MAFDWFRRKFQQSSDPAESAEPEAAAPQAAPEASRDEAPGEASRDETASETETEADSESLAWAKAAFQNIKQQQAAAAASPGADRRPPAMPPEPAAEDPAPSSPSPSPSPSPSLAAATQPEVKADSAVEAGSELAAEPELAVEAQIEAAPEITAEIAAEPEITAEQPSIEAELTPEAERVEAEVPDPEAAPEAIATATKPGASQDRAESADAVPESAPEPATEPVTEPGAQPRTEPSPEPSPETAPLSFLARAEAEREARLERLQAQAIDEPEPEPEPEPAALETAPPGMVFDADFIWSAEVLASQGRSPDQISIEEITWLKRLRQGLGKTRLNLINQLKAIVGQGPLNGDAVDEIESLLLQADVGVDATDYIIEALQAKLKEEVLPPVQAIAYLKGLLRELLDSPLGENDPPVLAPAKDQLNIWLMTGVNGAGKTTTIGKLAHLATKSDYRCLIAAADTFRAAAVQQVQVWGDRSGIEVIANPGQNTDPAAVVFDAIAAAQSRNTEILLVDTAGRLQNKKNLMAELAKVRGIIDKKAPHAKVESLLVLDATLGQNGLRQAEVFAQAASLTGVVLTKLDGTARGGVALAVVRQLGLPIRFIGAGEGISDLRPFSSYEFVEALLSG